MSAELPSEIPRQSVPQKISKTCATCRSRKTKCSGGLPKCSVCTKLNVPCVYKPYERKILILKSTLTELEERVKALTSELAQLKGDQLNKPSPAHSTTSTEASDVTLLSTDTLLRDANAPVTSPSGSVNNLESGSSDMIIMKFAKMRNIDVNYRESSLRDEATLNSNKIVPPMSLSTKEPGTSSSATTVTVFQTLYNLTLEESLDLIGIIHFYLSDFYFPYNVELMIKKLRQWYSEHNGFTFLYLNLKQSKVDTYSSDTSQNISLWEPLALIALALGRQYKGFVNTETENLLLFALKCIPFTRMRTLDQGFLVVSAVCMASLYYRAVGRDDDAIMFSNLSIQFIIHLKLNSADSLATDTPYEKELKARATWVSFGLNRTLSAKLGGVIQLKAKDIERPLPVLESYDEDSNVLDRHEGAMTRLEFQLYIELTSVAEEIFGVIYSKDITSNLSSTFGEVIQRLINWNDSLPDRVKLNYDFEGRKHKRLVYSLHLNYCFCIHLTTIPIMFNLAEKQKTSQEQIVLTDAVSELLTICMNAAQLTVNILINCVNDNMLAIFGMMDVDYIYSSGLTFFLCGDVLNIDTNYCKKALESCLMILNRMVGYGNTSAKKKYDRLASLIDGYRNQVAASLGDHSELSQVQFSPALTATATPSAFVKEGTPDVGYNTGEFNNFAFENNSLDSSLELSSDVVRLFQSLTDRDLNIWEDGYKTWNQTDKDWEGFERSIFQQKD